MDDAEPQPRRELFTPTIDPSPGGGAAAGGWMEPQTQLGRFVILRQLGAGGMGTVFAAYDEKLDRKVALKVLHGHGDQNQTQQERTLREAKALAAVAHPRVVSIYEVAESDGQLYLAMEFIDGCTLRQWQGERPRPWREVASMYIQAGEGLRAAHAAGVVHRDFKPDNVLVGHDGLPRVVDFGLARLRRQPSLALPAEGDATGGVRDPHGNPLLTYRGVISGTLGYMSPEQYGDEPVEAASDQFSFCAALYEALYGYLPFPGETAAQQAVSVRGPVRPAPSDTQVPEEVYRILVRGLATDPAQRFPSMDALLVALGHEQGQGPAAAALSRRRIFTALSLISLLTWLAALYLIKSRGRIAREAIGLSVILLLILLWGGYMQRRAIMTNAFHRRMWTLVLINFMQNMLVRVTTVLNPAIPFRAVFTIEMIVWLGTTISMAALPVRSLYWVPAIPLGAGLTAVLYDAAPRPLLLLAYPLLIGSVLWGWQRAAQQRS